MRRCTLLALAALGLGLPASGARADEKGPGPLVGLIPRVTLGIAVEELPNDAPHGGVVVRHLTPDGPAAKAGLKTGDIIVRVSNMQVDDFDELLGAIAGHKPGDELTVSALRDGEPVRAKVTLGGPTKGAAPPEGCRSSAFLGVLTGPATGLAEATADRLGLTDDKGLVVIDTVPGSPAAQAGLRYGDVIRAINGAEVRDPDALRMHVKEAGPGKEVTLAVRRGDRAREVKTTLTEGPCDVLLVTPRGGADAARQIDRLQQQVEQLEKRIRELEGKREPGPKK